HVPPRVRGLRPPVQQDQRDRPATVLDHAQPPACRHPAVGIVGAAPAVIADHVADSSQAAAPSALTHSGENIEVRAGPAGAPTAHWTSPERAMHGGAAPATLARRYAVSLRWCRAVRTVARS